MLTGSQVSSLSCVYFTDLNIMQKRNPMELNFEGLQKKK